MMHALTYGTAALAPTVIELSPRTTQAHGDMTKGAGHHEKHRVCVGRGLPRRRRRAGPCYAPVWAMLSAASLAACVVSTPDDMQIPSPDGQFLLEIGFSGGGVTLRPGLKATLSLRHQTGERQEFASWGPIRKLQAAWPAPRRLRICADEMQELRNEAVTVAAPGGPVEFQVQYACPALVTGAQGRTFPAGDKSQQGVE